LFIGTLINYFIATPNVKKTFIESKIHILETSKGLIYNLINNENEIDLEQFQHEINSLESRFNLYKQEINYNVREKQISEASINILNMMGEIYNDLHTLLRLDMKPILNDENTELYTKIYSRDLEPTIRENSELDIVYNFHLNRILKNLIEIQTILNN
jgi:hypothetical protein